VRLPKEVLDLFPLWEYRCPVCGTYVELPIVTCPKCGLPFNEQRWRVPPRFLKSYKAMSEYAHKVLAPKLNEKQRQLLFKYFTTLFEDGFESGDFSAWSGTSTTSGQTIEVTTANPKQGSYNARSNLSGSGTRRAYCYKSGFNESIIHVRLYVMFKDAIPNASYSDGIIVMYVRNVENTAGLFQVAVGNTDSRWQGNYRKAGAWTEWYNASYTASLDVWYCVEAAFYIHATEGYHKVWVDETLIFEDTNIDTSQNGNAGEVRVGAYGSYSTNELSHKVDIDCVVVADTYIGALPPPVKPPEENPLICKPLVSPLEISKPVIR